MATTTQHKQIRIDGMTGDECCQKVTDALENVEGVQVESVEVGSATISADNERTIASARQAIDELGFSARKDAVSPKPEGQNQANADKQGQQTAQRSGQQSNQQTGQQSNQQSGSQSGSQSGQRTPSGQRNDSGYRAQNSNQDAPTGIGRAAAEGAEESVEEDGQDETSTNEDSSTDQDKPTAEIDRGAASAKKKVGDAGRDDRDRGDPMPERVKGPKDEANARNDANKGQRPANNDKNPSTNPGNQRSGSNTGSQGNARR